MTKWTPAWSLTVGNILPAGSRPGDPKKHPNKIWDRVNDHLDGLPLGIQRHCHGQGTAQPPLLRGSLDDRHPISTEYAVGIINKCQGSKNLRKNWPRSWFENPAVCLVTVINTPEQANLTGEKYYKTAISKSPDGPVFQALGRVYLRTKSMTPRSRRHSKRRLKQPDYGLDHERVECRRSQTFIWRLATTTPPNAITIRPPKAVPPKACSPLPTAIPRLKNWSGANIGSQQTSQQYDNSCTQWYDWCLLTGHGNIASARKLANPGKNPWDDSQIRTLALVDGNKDSPSPNSKKSGRP